MRQLTETSLVPQVKARLLEVFQDIGGLDQSQVQVVETEGLLGERLRADLILQVIRRDDTVRIVVEIKQNGLPAILRTAAQRWLTFLEGQPRDYVILAAPYVSERGYQVCKERGVGFVDLAGNTFIQFKDFYVKELGNPNPFPSTRSLKGLFAPKSSRVLRVLLNNPDRCWSVSKLAHEADVSVGLASNIKQRLFAEAYLEKDLRARQGFFLRDPWELLNAWTERYTWRKNGWSDYYSLLPVEELEARIVNVGRQQNTTYAFTLFSGARYLAPYTRYNRVFVYVSRGKSELVASLKVEEVPSGPNLTILTPYDEGVFYGVTTRDEAPIVSAIQLYLDLVNYRGRGKEAAEFLLKEVIQPQW